MSTTRQWLGATIIVALLGGALGYFAGHRVSLPRDATTVHANAERKVLYWHDPMAPGTKFDKPGKSPFMDMQLVPVYADEATDSGVRVAPNVVQNLGIRLGKVERSDAVAEVRAVGSVVFDERLQEIVQSRVAGNVMRLHVKAPLVSVRRGQPLLQVFAPDWLAAQQDYLALLDAPAAAQSIRDAARERLHTLGISDRAIAVLEQERKTTATTTIVAPLDGIVTELNVREGSAFAAGAPLMRINGLTSVWVNAQIPEGQVSSIAAQAAAQIQANAWPGQIFQGHVLALLPDVDPQTRTLTARVAIDNTALRLSPGMFVSLAFRGATGQPQLVVPSEAVIVTGERSVVIVKRDDGMFDAVNVTVGAEIHGMSTILSGLAAGQSVVLSGQFLLDSEANLRSTVDRLGSAATAEQEHR